MPNMQQLETKNVAELEPPKSKLFYQSRREIFFCSAPVWIFTKILDIFKGRNKGRSWLNKARDYSTGKKASIYSTYDT